jgi:hypothetical protein
MFWLSRMQVLEMPGFMLVPGVSGSPILIDPSPPEQEIDILDSSK